MVSVSSLLPRLRVLNNILMIPMFTLILAEVVGNPTEAELVSIEEANIVFCALFFTE